MKNISVIAIAIIGRNQVFAHGGCPLHSEHEKYNEYFRALTDCSLIIIPKEVFDLLPDKSTPYPCRNVCVVGENVEIDQKAPRTKSVPTLNDALTLTGAESEKIFILTNKAMYEEVLDKHCSILSGILVVTINKDIEGTDTFIPPSLLQWHPVIVKDEPSKGRRVPGFTITKYLGESALA